MLADLEPTVDRVFRAMPNAMMADLEPTVDGVFRAMPNGVGRLPGGGVQESKSGQWMVSLNLSGELYRAFFDSEEDADEAFHAAGGVTVMPVKELI
eukprot:gene22684-29836_t